MGIPFHHPIASYLRKYAICLARGVYIFSDGEMWAQVVFGSMKSGVAVTSTWNTVIRCFLSLKAGPGLVKASADDCIEQRRPGALKVFEQMGYLIKDYDVDTTDHFECCSHLWVQGQEPYPLRFAKATFNFVAEPITAQTAYSYVEKFHRVVGFSDVLAYIHSCAEGQESNLNQKFSQQD